ncbi:phenylacetate--CoA ligase family protein [Edaphobacillus lindanitolerans]|uniref:Phenylacetate-CoA ligase n=1 Tax=Edaphobacillus lindanitolerans TaxID=550447 RepID=A0A1U7PN55_9BACI|nr:phenylacetate--CoA ligase family protein [Edaphobacillus lindanitolerans]SIT73551.1 phenylacetate-CoA ligase [Edaphobacillus lindanitolerans]
MKIYDYAPIALQNIAVSLKGLQLNKQRYNVNYYNELELLRKNSERKEEFQLNRLREFIAYAKNNSEYYSEVLQEINPSTFSLQELSSIPILEKETLRTEIERLRTTDQNVIVGKTGGSTGKSLTFYTSAFDMSRKIAFLDYFKEQHGVKKGMKRASIGGREIVPNSQKSKVFWRFNKSLNQMLFSAYHADGENLYYYIKQLNKFQPQSIDGYTATIHRIAKFILDKNIKLSFSPLAIFPTAETLTEEMRTDMEQAFGCPVRNQYASSEGAPFITEDQGGVLIPNIETGVFEYRPLYDNVYELIVTAFYTTTTPLIRYRIGDAVELYDDPSKVKVTKIKKIIGRSNDFLVSKERGVVTNVNLSTAVREADRRIIESQFIQNELDRIKVYLVVSEKDKIQQIESRLSRSLRIRFGESTIFDYEYVEAIPKTTGGKRRFVVNNLND